MGVDQKGKDDEKSQKEEHRHREDKSWCKEPHQAGKPPCQKDRSWKGSKKLEIGDKGSASSRISNDKSIAHASENTKIDIDQADDKEHEGKQPPFFTLHWENQFFKHLLQGMFVNSVVHYFTKRLSFPQSN